MDKKEFIRKCHYLFAGSKSNYISKEKALLPELISTQIFNEPLIMMCDADNTLFHEFKKETIIGAHFLCPTEWLVEGKIVISFFFPFTDAIRNSNKENMNYPSKGWLNGRIEGQSFINEFTRNIINLLKNEGYKAVAPSVDSRFIMNTDNDTNKIRKLYTSNWSERHIAFACGLGTFSLSKGLITEKGMAGRFTSIITDLNLKSDSIKFDNFEDNCTKCGKCISNCPVNAISHEYGKNHKICSEFINSIMQENSPWYGCGKCQINVPCESFNPKGLLKQSLKF